jgi:hypothetical protein
MGLSAVQTCERCSASGESTAGSRYLNDLRMSASRCPESRPHRLPFKGNRNSAVAWGACYVRAMVMGRGECWARVVRMTGSWQVAA